MVAGGLSSPARAAKMLSMLQDTNNQSPKNTASLAAEERIEKRNSVRVKIVIFERGELVNEPLRSSTPLVAIVVP
jgi:hypothetical protein